MNTRIFLVSVFFLCCGICYCYPSIQDRDGVTWMPILSPIDQSNGNGEESNEGDHHVTGSNNEDEDFEILRPYPTDDVQEINSNQSPGKDDETDKEDQVPRPYFKNQGLSSNEDEDDTVVVEAASCGELLNDCKEKNDLVSCEAYNENCNDDNGDQDDLENWVDCVGGKCL